MFVYDLFFYLKPEFEDYLITDYLCSLSGNNQIIFETINISGTDNMRIVRVTVRTRILSTKNIMTYTQKKHYNGFHLI